MDSIYIHFWTHKTIGSQSAQAGTQKLTVHIKEKSGNLFLASSGDLCQKWANNKNSLKVDSKLN